jgi:hypothetical protein
MYLLARNEAANKWLAEHPAVLGAGAIGIGALLLFFGISALISGRSTDKWGREHQGGTAYLVGGIQTLFGAGATLFGLFKLVSSLF